MNLWLLQPIDPVAARRVGHAGGDMKRWTWDCAYGFVVRAENEEAARALAADEAGDEGGDAWSDPKFTTCERLEDNGEAEVVIRDFCAG